MNDVLDMLMALLFVAVVAVVSAPFRLWCRSRHRNRWQITAAGWGWYCTVDGFDWAFSDDDVRQITRQMAAAGRAAADEFLGVDQ